MKPRRWWQRGCPFTWHVIPGIGDDISSWHIHHCRRVGSGEPHTHVCDCGALMHVDFVRCRCNETFADGTVRHTCPPASELLGEGE